MTYRYPALILLLLITGLLITQAQDDTCTSLPAETLSALAEQCTAEEAGTICTATSNDSLTITIDELADELTAPTRIIFAATDDARLTGVLVGGAVIHEIITTDAPTAAIPARNSAGYNVNLRAGPGTDYEQVGIFSFTETATATGRLADSSWVRLMTDADGIAWIASNFVALEGDIDALPVVTAGEAATQQALTLAVPQPCAGEVDALIMTYTGISSITVQVNDITVQLSAGTFVFTVPDATEGAAAKLVVTAITGDANLARDDEIVTLSTGERVTLTADAAVTDVRYGYDLAATAAIVLPDNDLPCIAGTTDDAVSVYPLPDSDSDVLTTLDTSAYTVIGRSADDTNGAWWQLSLGDENGWVAQDMVETVGLCDAVTVVDPAAPTAPPPAEDTTTTASLAPDDVIFSYLQARVNSNVGRMQALSCAAWDAQARVQAQSFRAMQANLEGVGCSVTSENDSSATVFCSGNIVTEYNGQTRTWALGNYSLIREDNQWRMCGES